MREKGMESPAPSDVVIDRNTLFVMEGGITLLVYGSGWRKELTSRGTDAMEVLFPFAAPTPVQRRSRSRDRKYR
jgi:hypothetical protein